MAAYEGSNVCLMSNCEFCGQKGDCVLQVILQKLIRLESIIENKDSQAPVLP